MGAVAARPAQEGEAITDCNREKSLRFVGVGIALLRRRSPPYALRSDRARSRRMSSVSACSRSPCPSMLPRAAQRRGPATCVKRDRAGRRECACAARRRRHLARCKQLNWTGPEPLWLQPRALGEPAPERQWLSLASVAKAVAARHDALQCGRRRGMHQCLHRRARCSMSPRGCAGTRSEAAGPSVLSPSRGTRTGRSVCVCLLSPPTDH